MNKRFRLHLIAIPFAILGLLSLPVSAQSGATDNSSRDFSYTISTSQPWTDTGVDLQTGDMLEISASAPSNNRVPDRHAVAESTCDPNGAIGAAKSTTLPVPESAPGSLIVRLQAQGSAVVVGDRKSIRVEAPGHLFLGVNSDGTPPCAGNFAVKVSITSGVSTPAETTSTPTATAAPDMAKNATATTPPTGSTGTQANQVPDIKQKLATAAQVWLQGQFGTDKSAAGTTSTSSAVGGNGATAAPAVTLDVSKDKLDPTLAKDIDGLPRRVNDEFNNQGDMVNFVIVGSQSQVQAALEAANWHVADTNNTESAMKAVLETYQKKDYLTMPMSQLRLFGRVQDYGYEQAEVYAVVASRHHFRIWKAPFTYKGEVVWVGAGTHDIGFEKDQRNGKVTHKIDPAVDGERDNIGSSLQKAEKVKTMYYYLPPNPVQDARNATGGGYHSDGRMVVMLLK
jgi:hypothetical protein